MGFPEAAARDYAQVGCVETYIPGQSAPWTDAYLNLAKCLELALNNGRDLLTGIQIGPATGDARQFASFEDLFTAYMQQVNTALRQMLAAKDEYDARVSAHAPEPLNSAFILDSLASGRDASGGGARYLLTGVYGVGLGTTTDSLAAIQAGVFEQPVTSLAQVCGALQANFKGFERLHAFCQQRAPKYGNDDDRADAIAVRLIESFGRQVKAYSDEAWRSLLQANPQADRAAQGLSLRDVWFGAASHFDGRPHGSFGQRAAGG